MSTALERSGVHARGWAAIDHYELELIDQLGQHVSRLWEYDRQLAEPHHGPETREFLHNARSREREVIQRLKLLIDDC